MSGGSTRKEGLTFTPEHHAMLFGWIAKAVVDRAGVEVGERVVRRAVQRYGRERGGRMAARVLADGRALTVAAYFGYGEWCADPATMSQSVEQSGKDLRLLVDVCPWHTAWQAAGLLEYGRLYCLEIDRALVAGFNRELLLDVEGTRPNGGPRCDFVFRGGLGAADVVRPERDVVMPWAYHLGHLYWSLRAVILAELKQTGAAALHEALKVFGATYGNEAVTAILAYRDTDFTVAVSPNEV